MHLSFCFESVPTEQTPAALLRYYRRQNGLTTRQLAESVGIVPTTVLMYERGQFPIPYQTAVAMAKVLEIDRNLLFDEFAQFLDYPYSDRLREVRKAHRLNQATFAEKAGISLRIYSKWEGGSRQPSRKMYPGFPRIHTSLTLTIRPETLGNIEFNCIFTCHLAHSVV